MVKLYSTGCPKCRVLEHKLKEKQISYEKCDNVDEMLKLGFCEVPKFDVDGTVMGFVEANKGVDGR